MAFWYGLSAIVAIVVALPFARLALRRISCAKKIKGYCKEKGYKIYPTHRLWYFSGNRSERCDLYLETEKEVLSIKLFGVSRRRRVLIFKDDGGYFIRRFISIFSYGSVMRFPVNGRTKAMVRYDFRYKYREEWDKKALRQVLLVNPAPTELKRIPLYGGETAVAVGDTVCGAEIVTLSQIIG